MNIYRSDIESLLAVAPLPAFVLAALWLAVAGGRQSQ